MGDHVVPFAVLGDESTEFHVLDRYILTTRVQGEDFFQFFLVEIVLVGEYGFYFLLVGIVGECLRHALKGYRSGVGDIGNDGILYVVVYCLQYSRAYKFAEGFPLFVYVRIRSAGEVNTFERAFCGFRRRLFDSTDRDFAVPFYDYGTAGFQFLYFGQRNVERCHYGRSLGSHNGYFIVAVIEARSYSVFVSKHKSIAMSYQACHHIASVPFFCGGREYGFYVEVLRYTLRDFYIGQSLLFVLLEKRLDLSIEELSYLFENYCGVCNFHGVLSERYKLVQHLVYVGKVEISCQDEVAGLPVVLPQKGVQIFQFVFAESAVA